MKLHASGPVAWNTITGYGEGYVLVNNQRFESSLIVTPEEVRAWEAADFSSLAPSSFQVLETLRPEIVLLGTGARQRFPDPKLIAALASARIGVEVMDLKAACRTYNILAAESRKVAAALLMR